jgi:hypothetical protein
MESSRPEKAESSSRVHRAEVALVLDYLAHCETDRLTEARACLAPGTRHTFPGGRTFDDLGEWHADFRSRMSRLRKRDHQIDVCDAGEEGVVVYVRGRLTGRTVDGAEFDDVRFIDRLVVRNGSIVDQAVWNDLSEHGLAPTSPTNR